MNTWIFDVDGVLVDPVTKTADTDVLPFLVKILEKGDFLALNTGRSLSWTEEKILSPLLDLATNHELFKNIFVVCEMGNVLVTFENNGWNKKLLDNPLPEDLQEKMRTLAEEYKESVFYDASKETMISIEMRDGYDIKKFEGIVKDLYEKVEEILRTSYHSMELRVDATQIALDVQYEDAGKQLGAERIEDFMLERAIKPEEIYTFGDSPSDTQMAEGLQDKYKVTFVYVGDKTKLNTDNLTCEMVYPGEKFTKGTLEFLTAHL